MPTVMSPGYTQQPILVRPQPPRIYEFAPQHGAEGEVLTITLTSEQPGLPLKIGFGSFIAETKQLYQPQYTTLTARVPAFSLTRCHELGVPLSIIAWSGDNEATDSWLVGYFVYDLDDRGHGQRKRGADATQGYDKAYKRLSGGSGTGSISSRTDDNSPSVSGYMVSNNPGYSTAGQFYNIAPAPTTLQGYNSSGFRSDESGRNFFPEAGQIMGVGYPYRPPPQSSSGAPSTTATQPMSDSSFGYTHASASDMPGNSPGMAPPVGNIAMPNVAYGMSQTSSPGYIAHPVPQASLSGDFTEQPGKGSIPMPTQPSTSSETSAQPGPDQGGEFNPYAQLLNKANLIIDGDLDTMTQNWTEEEWNNRRRLVQFWRRQENNEITCTFAPVTQADRQPNSIVVSCIYWEDHKECFITSVDTIFLLESLIGVRFTVEEKNRIRRNLEGFRPLTVSKLKPDSAEFFKLVMSFPNPKPRNIEKDVKAFHWTTLPLALKKIIGKYTASYSSTASVNLDALHSAYPAVASLQSSPSQLSAGASVGNPMTQATESQPPKIADQQSAFGAASIEGFSEPNLYQEAGGANSDSKEHGF
ncbi:hypothetical protein NQZ79_g1568 [Umbelopsis isabellina]|nr:hypothetical protein NQZ79_g1568 [Umbelopsis isabellina]